MARRPPAFAAYLAVLTVVASALLAIAVAGGGVSQFTEWSLTGWLFLALLLAGELRPLNVLPRQEEVSLTSTWLFAFALLLTEPTYSVLLAVTATALAAELAARHPAERILFNTVQVMLSFAAGAFLLDLSIGADFLAEGAAPTLAFVVVVLVAGLATFVTNALLYASAVGLATGDPVLQLVRRIVQPATFATDGLLVALSPVLVVVAQRGLILVPLLLTGVLAIFQTSRMALESERDALHDNLTGLANRRLFRERLDEVVEESVRESSPCAALLIDLDGFKQVNDTYGHEAGDQALVEVAERLRAIEGLDAVARLGGDEFAALVRAPVTQAEAHDLATEIVAALAKPMDLDDTTVALGGSVGLAIGPRPEESASELLRRSDAAMYRAKQGTTPDGWVLSPVEEPA